MLVRTKCLAAVSMAVAIVSGCSDSPSSSSETAAPTDPPTTIATADTVPAPTTLPASEVFLRSDGIGAFTFGAPYEGFSEGIPLEEDSNDGARFVVDMPGGFFGNDDGDQFFTYPSARVVCWNDGLDGVNGYLCAYFGGPDNDTLTFVGWDYTARTGIGTLFSSFGITVNALVSDVPAIPADTEDCEVVDGIDVELDIADAYVAVMSAGETFVGLIEFDC